MKEVIQSARYLISSATHKQCPPADRPEYAFIGRSNVGKSSLINMLTAQQRLAKTSATPGKTQLINHFEVVGTDKKKWYLVDLPGYGYAATVSQKARNNWGNMIESYIRKRENLVSLFVLIDSRHLPQAIDLEFIRQLGEWKVPFSIIFTKTDKNKPGATIRNVETFKKALLQEWQSLPPLFLTSAVKKEGREELLFHIRSLYDTYGAP
ncbi:MAG: YihA family ribosome biogenesis GTP-binding protein [Sphingomonadales bacterium]|nr:YihA family ribosome biogenesis GTP-binding protein [Sphingomonadales bacterium]